MFHLKDATAETIRNTLDPYSSLDISKECLDEARGLKIKKTLGSVLTSINITKDGYKVSYGEGDICEIYSSKLYSSEVNYVCNNETDDFGWPTFAGKVGECHFKFEWISKWACP